MVTAILLLASSATLAAASMLRLRRRRQPLRHAGIPVMLSSWADGQELTVAVHLQRKQR